jgi:uncharacterized repeat protein (TIGR03803 family)
MKKVQQPTVAKTQTVTTSRIPWQPLIGLVALIVVMSVVVLSGQELKHVPPASPSYTVLHSFTGGPDGANPYAGLIRDGAGNLYGTTAFGGASGAGVAFKLTPTGTYTVLYSFTSGPDGAVPYAGLIRDAAGNLYGTTAGGGTVPDPGCYGNDFSPCGVVFKLSPAGTEAVLHNFVGTDGANPYAGLVRDEGGNLYGTTSLGGASGRCRVAQNEFSTCGTIFKISATGTEAVLYSFTGGMDGAEPYAGLLRDGEPLRYHLSRRSNWLLLQQLRPKRR